MRQPPKKSAERWRAEKRRDPVGANGLWKASEYWKQRRAKPKERRRHHHEQDMLEHVDLQEQRCKRLDRRRQGQVDNAETSQESVSPACWPSIRISPV
jgi:hypothetical protein